MTSLNPTLQNHQIFSFITCSQKLWRCSFYSQLLTFSSSFRGREIAFLSTKLDAWALSLPSMLGNCFQSFSLPYPQASLPFNHARQNAIVLALTVCLAVVTPESSCNTDNCLRGIKIILNATKGMPNFWQRFEATSKGLPIALRTSLPLPLLLLCTCTSGKPWILVPV